MATELQPGDPGWTLVPTTPAPAPVATPAPVGPLPGERGFDLSKVPIAPVPVSVPAPVSQKQAQFQADLAAADQASGRVSEYADNVARMQRSGVPMVQGIAPDQAQALVDASRQVSPSSNIVYAQPPAPRLSLEGGADPLAGLLRPVVTPASPAHEVALVSKERQGADQNAIEGENTAIAGEQAAESGLGEARAGVTDARAAGATKVADANRVAGQETKMRGFANKEEAQAYRKKIEAFSEDAAADKVDPNGMWHNASIPRQITWTLAKAFGAIQQGLLHLPSNQIADQIDAMARADVEAQKANHAIKRGRLEDMKTFYDYAIKEGKDAGEADRLAHGFAVETARNEALALGEAAQSPVARAEAAKVAAALDEKIAQNMTRSVERGIAHNRWVQATPGSVSYGGLTAKDLHTLQMKRLEKEIDIDANAREGQAASERKRADELKTIQTTIDEQDKQIANILKLPIFDKLGTGPAVAGALGAVGQRVMPESAMTATEVNGLNQLVIGAVGKQLKDSEGRIAPPVLEAIHKLEIKAGDTPEVARGKVQQIRNFLRETARQGGATAEEPNRGGSGASFGFTPAGARAEGGKVERQPYLVGEKGPELLLPNKPDVVLSALQTAADRGAPPTRQQMSTLSDSVRRFAEKAGVLKRADGGAVKPSPPAMTPEDEEEMRKFFGDKPTEKFAPPTDEDKRLADEENRRGEELQKQAIADAQRRNAEAQRAAAEEEYYRDRPVERWARRAASALAPSPEIRAGREQAFGETLANVRRRVNDFTGQYVPDDLRVALAQAPVGLGYRPEHDSRISTRQPVSISRGEMSAVPIGDADGEQLRMSPEGRAYYTAPEAERESRIPAASLSGASRTSSSSAAPAAVAQARARKLTPAELLAQADAAIARTERDERNALAAGPAVRRLAPGTPENGYTTELTAGAEPAYESWRQRTSPYDTGRDYDLRGAFAEGLDRDPRGHLPDTYKKPNHETFSDESMYARYAPEEAGSWSGETYRPKGPPAWLRQAQAEEDAPPTSIADVLRPR